MASDFPQLISTSRFGPLRLHEILVSDFVSRNYQPERAIPVPALGDIDLVIWPHESGVSDLAKFATFVERTWDRVVGSLPDIRIAAVPDLEDTLSWFWQIEDEPLPDAAVLLTKARLHTIKINLDGDHELGFDDAGMVGDHDLLIRLDHRLNPIHTQFDG